MKGEILLKKVWNHIEKSKKEQVNKQFLDIFWEVFYVNNKENYTGTFKTEGCNLYKTVKFKTSKRKQRKPKIPIKYPAYISWEKFIANQNKIKDNYNCYREKISRGIERKGKALLQGIIYCGRCGRKMRVLY